MNSQLDEPPVGNLRVLSLVMSWLELNSDQLEQFHAIVATFNDRDDADAEKRRIIRELDGAFASLDIGPLKKPCPTCGR